jgi:flagellar protein FlbD
MIQVTHLDRSSFVLNCDLIEQIETTPDTVITLTNNHKITVLETAEEIVERIRSYRKSIYLPRSAGDVHNGLTEGNLSSEYHGRSKG